MTERIGRNLEGSGRENDDVVRHFRLLGINAARAGDVGKGLAVVASKIQRLARMRRCVMRSKIQIRLDAPLRQNVSA
ncbi:hypothetical protein [Agrobacterium cavarae]|uniref:hypothetical protein n=1 Tax=Agrobacterium cavarae TaxID=2528239 RepID=UPI003EE4BECF